MSLKLPDGYMLVFIFSMIIGGVSGQLVGLTDIMAGLSDQLKSMVGASDSDFTEGLITAFLLFCIGSMTIVGALEEGLSKDRNLLYIKSTLDGFTAIALTATYGIGVLFSIIPMLFFQGGITVFGISINMLQLGNITLENLLPAIVVGIIFSKVYQKYQSR